MKIHAIFDVTMAPDGFLIIRDSTNDRIMSSQDTMTIESDFENFLNELGIGAKVEIYEDE